jgi:hypothetical protein
VLLSVTQMVPFIGISGLKYSSSIVYNLSVLLYISEIVLPLYHRNNLKLLLIYYALSVTVRGVESLRLHRRSLLRVLYLAGTQLVRISK